MSTAVTRRRTLKHTQRRDSPYIGWREDDKQQRFNLGKDMTEAEWRYAAIQDSATTTAAIQVEGFGRPCSRRAITKVDSQKLRRRRK